MYADYEYYRFSYNGSLLEEEQWPAAVRAAEAYLDAVTFGRLRRGWDVDEPVRMACCAAAEVAGRYQRAAAERAPGLSGFNNDGYSESYAASADLAAQQQAEMGAAVDLYLPRSHPLRYAGGDGCAGL